MTPLPAGGPLPSDRLDKSQVPSSSFLIFCCPAFFFLSSIAFRFSICAPNLASAGPTTKRSLCSQFVVFRRAYLAPGDGLERHRVATTLWPPPTVSVVRACNVSVVTPLLPPDALALLGEHGLDVEQDAALGDGHAGQELVKLRAVPAQRLPSLDEDQTSPDGRLEVVRPVAVNSVADQFRGSHAVSRHLGRGGAKV
jgi:hypothetical protein